ncbi:hypothetical protein FHR72_004950 [Mycolicibacterium iranicum]|uniref:DUF3592 domain-containing protein n=1 Tax=Mycolicibacterium iranicum TaxID=912594 RepID=A0A839QMQ9_MYCIR|nr:hypothetical protein [Mycolicibacterium iranicum]MBB2993441.1 hypothetical protein [Mycolicibacterium iranicum]
MPSLLTLMFFSFLIAGTAAVLLVPSHAVVRSRGVVVGLRLTGDFTADCHEVELDVMVSRPEGGQFPARETTLIPEASLAHFTPGSIIDMYYRPGDESSVAVRVPRRGHS